MGTYVPELGQMVFGNPWSAHEAPYFYEGEVSALGEILEEMKLVKHNPAGNVGEEFENDTFAFRSYYWGECECGYDNESWEWEKQNPHTEECFHTRYYKNKEYLTEKGNTYHQVEKKLTKWAKDNGHPDGVTGVAVYCTCGRDKKWREWVEAHGHKPDCKPTLPNFVYKPTGFEMRWYKYIGRGTTTSFPDLTPSQLRILINDCVRSLD